MTQKSVKKEHRPVSKRRWNKFIHELINKAQALFYFFTIDIWRTTSVKGSIHSRLLDSLRIIILSVRRYREDELQHKASALTYYTMLSIIPLLALLFGIARGFGLQDDLQNELEIYFEAQSDVFNQVLVFIDSYLRNAQSGIFLGIGFIFLFWTAMSLIGTIEESFNDIWQVKKGRTYWRKFTDYFSMILILPVLIISSSGMSIFVTTRMSQVHQLQILSPVVEYLIKLSPYIISSITLTCVYVYLPNTKVRLKNALISGIITGVAFQLFQFLYINGQIYVSKYNAIYGSFAAIPLLLLWLQLSWLIVLFGAELAFAGQNIEDYYFEADSKHISRRYNDFLMVIVASTIAHRFAKGEPAISAEELSIDENIPIRLSRQIVNNLLSIGIIVETSSDKEKLQCYQPAIDINMLTIGYLFEKMDLHGSENFKVDKEQRFKPHWKKIIESRLIAREVENKTLLKDL